MKTFRDILVGSIAGLLAVAAIVYAFSFDGSTPGDQAVHPSAPDPRVVWTAYGVAGYRLCNSDTCLVLPPGATLWIAQPGDTLPSKLDIFGS